MNFDVIIIGGGAAGLSAGLWCDDLGLKAILLERDTELGGQLLWTHNSIENHLGAKALSGSEMRDIFVSQIKNRKFIIKTGAKIEHPNLEEKKIILESGEEFSGRAIIIATGISRRRLNIPGENRFQGKGIIRSGKRDGETARGKNAVIIGGGDAAFENVLILSEFAKKITLVHRRSKFSARKEFIEPAKKLSQVEILTDSRLSRIDGDDRVDSVLVENIKTGDLSEIPAEVVLIRIGVEPNTAFLQRQIELDERGFIKVDFACRTNLKDIYAVGDVANSFAPTVSTAVGMGATAVKTISSLLNN